ncbi:MAG: hypothetical protein RMM17_04055 [Acidobacteriota bacterium]|nr:hypothetical protein [Blastocatellia bacterium]MDW8411836.1 hypothetical protein [Acidobacteriota bacterium]
MKKIAILAIFAIFSLVAVVFIARSQLRKDLQKLTINVEGVERFAYIVEPKSDVPASGLPLVLVFHGHGGTALHAARKYRIHEAWPQAMVAYLQGIPGVAGITDPEGKQNGWQKNPGELNDRDLKFVDAFLAEIKLRAKIDTSRIYALGHSNGGRFAHVLWHQRGNQIAAVASCGGHGGTLIYTCIPRSIFVIAGQEDPLVPFQGQMLFVEAARQVLQTDPSKAIKNGYASIEPGANGLELGTYLHPGGHEWPKAATPFVIEFFKRHSIKQ